MIQEKDPLAGALDTKSLEMLKGHLLVCKRLEFFTWLRILDNCSTDK